MSRSIERANRFCLPQLAIVGDKGEIGDSLVESPHSMAAGRIQGLIVIPVEFLFCSGGVVETYQNLPRDNPTRVLSGRNKLREKLHEKHA
jgi:hypothetical protein